MLASNKVSTLTRATLVNQRATAAGDLSVTATDAPSIDATTYVGTAAQRTNDLGLGLLTTVINKLRGEYQFTTGSGLRTLTFGDRVRVAESYAGAGTKGALYEYMGTTQARNLGAQDYTNFELWKQLNDTTIVPQSVATAAVKALGLDNGGSKSYYGVVARNDVRGAAEASVVAARVSGRDITVRALEAARLVALDNSTTVAQTDAAGGAFAGNQVQGTADAFLRDSVAVAGRDLTIEAANAASIEATSTGKTDSKQDTIQVRVTLNTVGWRATNVLFQLIDALLGSSYLTDGNPAAARAYALDTPLTAGRDLTVRATNAAEISATLGAEQVSTATNEFVIKAEWGAKGLAAGAALASNKVNGLADASVRFTGAARGAVAVTGALTVAAADAARISADSSVVSTAVSTNNLDGVKAVLRTLFPDDYQFTTASGSRALTTGARVRLGATYAGGGDTGSVYRYTGGAATLNLSATNYAVGPWVKLVGSDGDLASLWPNLGNLADSDARAVGGLVVVNDARSSVSAVLEHATATAASIAISATESATIEASVDTNVTASGGSAWGSGTVLAVNAQVTTNLVLSSATARISDSALTGAVAVTADNTSAIDARLHSALSTGDTGAGFAIAFNTIGWKPSNVLFNLIDALIGDPLISKAFNGLQPASSRALIENSTVNSSGAVGVAARNAAQINATVSNVADSAASALFGATGKSIGGVLVSNKVASSAEAGVARSTVTAVGAVDVGAEDAAGIFANAKLVSSSVTSNDGGAAVLQSTINKLTPANYQTDEGLRAVKFGERVRIASGYLAEDFGSDAGAVAVATGQKVRLTDDSGAFRLTSESGRRLLITGDDVQSGDDVFRFLGGPQRVDLGAENFANAARWAKLGGDAGAVYQYLGSARHLNLSAQDYADTTQWRLLGGVEGAAYQYMGTDMTAAQDLATRRLPRPALLEADPGHRHRAHGPQRHDLGLERDRRARRLQRRPQQHRGLRP